MTNSCAGACCAVFPMDRKYGLADAKDDTEAAFIRDMRVPLTLEEATARYARLGYGALPDYSASVGSTADLYTCRHWDEETRLCGVYVTRPNMCRDYPYAGRSCDRGCGYALSQADTDAIAQRADGSWVWDVDGQGWRPRSSSDFLWDAEAGLLRPIPKVPA